jgi:hypothetical protein
MRIPNPIAMLKGWRDDRAIGKIRDQYKYSLRAYAKRHSSTDEKDDKFIILGILGYFGTLILSAYLQLDWLAMASFGVLLCALLLPFIASYYEQWVLKSKLTLTMKVVPNDAEETRPVTIRLEGVEWGAAIDTPEELIEFIQAENGHLTHAFTAPNGEAEQVLTEVLDNRMSLYPMKARGDPVPTLIQFPDDPEAELRPREEKVRLGYGLGKLRHATLTVLECEPVKTSIKAKSKIIDVEFALFSPLVTQKAIDNWLSKASWHVPTRVVENVATYVKQKVDISKNASYFAILEKQRDDAIRGREKLQLMWKTEQMNTDLDGEIMRGYKKPPGMYSFNDIIWWLIVAVAIGLAIMYVLLG